MIAGRKFDCPACGGSLEVRAAGYTTTVACRYCGSVIDVASPDATLITQYHQTVAELAIPLGTRGTIAGVEWEAIGWQSRTAGLGQDGESWDEFLLFNPYAGYRWLVRYDGEWTFGRALESLPEMLSDDVVRWQGAKWEVEDDPAQMVTTRVVGEFYWRVKVDETVSGRTFWSGDRQLSCEQNRDEVNWTALDPIDADEVAKAFGIDPDGFLGSHGAAASGSLTLGVGGPERTVTLGPIEVKRAWQTVTVSAAGDDFVNKWVDLDYALVDRTTHQAIDAGDTLEYYTGTDSDGAWTEGGHSTSTLIARVPRGTYDVVVTASAHAWSDGTASTTTDNPWAVGPGGAIALTISAGPGGMLWGNFVVALLLLFTPPCFFAWRKMKGAG
jgi:hypothetical protein